METQDTLPEHWRAMLTRSKAEAEGKLGAGDPRERCISRFGLACAEPLNAWYADELARGTDLHVLMQVLPSALGQIAATIAWNAGGHPMLAQAMQQLFAANMDRALNIARAGGFDDLRVKTPGRG